MQNTNEAGAAAIEYGLLLAAIATVLLAVAFGLGQTIAQGFTTLNNLLP